MRMRNLLLVLGLCMVTIISCSRRSSAELQRFEHTPTTKGNDGGSVSFLVIGDWGRRGQFNQSLVALQVKSGRKPKSISKEEKILQCNVYLISYMFLSLIVQQIQVMFLFVKTYISLFLSKQLELQDLHQYFLPKATEHRNPFSDQRAPKATENFQSDFTQTTLLLRFSQRSNQMGVVGENLDIDFVVSTGDNFYDNGLIGEHDVAFEESFTNVYTANSLQKQWYTVLGNHDYRGDVEAQLSPLLRKIDSRWLCLRSFVVNAAELAELFFLDTTPFVEMYFTNTEKHTYDWREVTSPKVYTTNLLKDLEIALKESRAKWKIVIGHHAIRSIGHHGDTQELVDRLLPILQANNVDFYMNGHDHCLEHISDPKSPIQFLTSGAGSKAWRGDVKKKNREGLNFFYDGQGFMSVQLTQTESTIVFYDVFGQVLHRWDVSKQLHLAI